MLKRIGLFLATNIAIVILMSVIMFVLEAVFNIRVTGYVYYFVFALIVWFSGSVISLFLSKWMAKRAYKLTMITKNNIDKLDKKERIVWDTVANLAEKNHIKMPEVWIYVDTDPNAFATWATKNSSLVAVSTGLLTMMDEKEIEWVIGHEMAHILNWDMVTMALLQWVLNTFVVFLSRVIWNILANMVDDSVATIVYYLSAILLEFLFWLLASIVVMWFSRHREYRADEWSARFVWKEKMIAWLKALQKMQNLAWNDKEQFAEMKISSRWKSGIMKLFSTHPALEDRIANLENKSF